MKLTLYYATNRRHVGEQWKPSGYGSDFSKSGLENLRFGKLTLEANAAQVDRHLARSVGGGHVAGDGEELATYLAKLAAKPSTCSIRPFREKLDPEASDVNQPQSARYGSEAMWKELRGLMLRAQDVLLYIHGYTVSWADSVGSALALQEMLARAAGGHRRKVQVVLFSWPSNGQMLPFVSYKSDRTDAKASGYAVGRAILKLRDYFLKLPRIARDESTPASCERQIHLLCHSMGNYVLQHALARIETHAGGHALPRLFDEIFMCAPDVDDDVFEPRKPLSRLPELANFVHVYHNRLDKALVISDTTKANPDRLGASGAALTALLHRKIHQIDCSPIVRGLIQHSYYLSGDVNADIRMTLDGVSLEATERRRARDARLANVWCMVRG
jgi:esterase/lipase superfamily enzyme